jgi:hypothetical protein
MSNKNEFIRSKKLFLFSLYDKIKARKAWAFLSYKLPMGVNNNENTVL